MTSELDYPVQELAGVEPVFVRAQIIQSMALLFQKAVPDLSLDDAMAAAVASWGTDWPDDPAPRTFEAAKEVVHEELQYWCED